MERVFTTNKNQNKNKRVFHLTEISLLRIMKLAFVLIFILRFSYCFAQSDTSVAGRVEIIQDNRVTALLEKHKIINEKCSELEGYRIQIYFESGNYSKKKAADVKLRFQNLFPDVEVYIIFQEPYYKVRVGDFRTRLNAQAFLQKIISDFPNAFVTKENKINYPKID